MVLRVVPIKIPPPINMVIEVAFADTTAPTNAINGGTEASHFRSTTSDKRPMIGDSTLCMSNGPWMIQPAREGSPRSLMMKAMTEPAATTTKTCAMMAKHVTKTTIHDRQLRLMCSSSKYESTRMTGDWKSRGWEISAISWCECAGALVGPSDDTIAIVVEENVIDAREKDDCTLVN